MDAKAIMDFMGDGSILVAVGVFVILIGLLIFYFKSVKYFAPYEIVAVLHPLYNTGEIDEDGNHIYDNYKYYKNGGKIFLPFWKNYFVLPRNIITSSIATQKFLTLDKLHIRVDFVIQYSIDVSTKAKLKDAFIIYADLTKNQNQIEQNFEKFFKGIIPEVLGKMKIDELIKDRDVANDKILSKVQEDVSKQNLIIESLKIETIHIENKAFYDKLTQTIAQRQEVELAKAKNETENEKQKFIKDAIARELENEKERFKLETAKKNMELDLKLKEIDINNKLKDEYVQVEEYNKAKILSTQRANKEAELEIEKLNLEISKQVNERKLVEDKSILNYIEEVNGAMQNANGFSAFLIMLKQHPSLIKELFGEGGLTQLAGNITKHLSSIDSITIADMGGGNGSGGASLEKLALLIPTIFSQTISKINKVGVSKTLADYGIDKDTIEKIKDNKELQKSVKEIGQKVGVNEKKLEEFYNQNLKSPKTTNSDIKINLDIKDNNLEAINNIKKELKKKERRDRWASIKSISNKFKIKKNNKKSKRAKK